MDLASLLKEFGPWVALVGYLVWQGWQREQRMAKRLDHVEDSIREHLVRVIEKNTGTMNQVLASLRSRPCLQDQAEPMPMDPAPLPPDLTPTETYAKADEPRPPTTHRKPSGERRATIRS